eukprot:933550-Pelagomonas_calceolata.AAC.2
MLAIIEHVGRVRHFSVRDRYWAKPVDNYDGLTVSHTSIGSQSNAGFFQDRFWLVFQEEGSGLFWLKPGELHWRG